MSVRRREKGNALVLVLIVVLLFAALSYAATRTSRGSQQGIEPQKLEMAVSQVLQYASSIQFAIERMRNINGCGDTDISFHSELWGHSDYEHPVPQPERCRVFEPQGGGIVLQTFIPSAGGTVAFDTADLPQVGSGEPELLFVIKGMKQESCLYINKQFGISNVPVPAETDTPGAGFFAGTYTPDPNTPGKTPGTAALRGRQFGCVYDTTRDYYVFYQVLLTR